MALMFIVGPGHAQITNLLPAKPRSEAAKPAETPSTNDLRSQAETHLAEARRQQEAGRLDGTLDAGEGDDLVEFGGSIGGNIVLGAGDDALGIYGAAALAAGAGINGGSGIDTIVFAGNTGTWDASRFSGLEALAKQGGGTSVLTGKWALGQDAISVVDSGILELAADAELSTAVEVAARGTFLVNGLVRNGVTITEAGGIVGGSGSIGTAADLAGGRKANLVNAGIVAPGGLRAGSEFGTLTVFGDYRQSAAGALEIELGVPGTSDLLDVRGAAALAKSGGRRPQLFTPGRGGVLQGLKGGLQAVLEAGLLAAVQGDRAHIAAPALMKSAPPVAAGRAKTGRASPTAPW